jgi:Ca2+:H+ antiporter
MISASPEFVTALKAAKKDDIQTVVNISFWAASATVLLTVPSMIILSYALGLEINLWITVIQWLLLWLIIILWLVHFNDWKLNRLEGFIFLLVFIIYIFLTLNWVS